jgi:hypothetical protein
MKQLTVKQEEFINPWKIIILCVIGYFVGGAIHNLFGATLTLCSLILGLLQIPVILEIRSRRK